MSMSRIRLAGLLCRRGQVAGPMSAVNGGVRLYSSEADPKARAQSIIDALPGNSVLSKSGILATGFAGGVYAIANSLYVVNAETCLLGVFAAFIAVASKTVAPAYTEWSSGHIDHIKDTLNNARQEHEVAVQDRIDNVNRFDNVVSTTKDLFAVSKQTVELEGQAFELQQKVDLAAEAKAVLDSWVLYESQVRQREQAELVKAVKGKVDSAISTDKFQSEALKQALVDVERVFKTLE